MAYPRVTFHFVVTIHGTHTVASEKEAVREQRALETSKTPTCRGYVVYELVPSKKKYRFIESRMSLPNFDKLSEGVSNAIEKALHHSQPALWSDGVTLTFKKVKPYRPPPPPPAAKDKQLIYYIITPSGVKRLPPGSNMNHAKAELQRLDALEIPALAVNAVYVRTGAHEQFRLEGGMEFANFESLEDFRGDPRGVYERMTQNLARYQTPASWYDGRTLKFKEGRVAMARSKSKASSISSVLGRATRAKTKPCKTGFAENFKVLLIGSFRKAVNDRRLAHLADLFSQCDWGDVPDLIARQNNARTHSLGGVIRGRYAHPVLGDVHITLLPKKKAIWIHSPEEAPQ